LSAAFGAKEKTWAAALNGGREEGDKKVDA